MHTKTRIVKKDFSPGKNIVTEEKQLNVICTSHYHNFYEIDIVLDGEGESICNGNRFEIKKGMISVLSPEDIHSYNINDEMHEINIQFTYDAIDVEMISFFNNIKSNVTYVDDNKLYSIYSLFCLLHNASDITDSREYSSHLLESIILSFRGQFEQRALTDKSSGVLQKILVYIHSHFKEDPKMKEVAELFYLNENYFSSMFKENMGICYKEYLRNLKLEHAKRLLVYTDYPITKIAYDSGYNSQSHFNRDFKKAFLCSPSNIRKSN